MSKSESKPTCFIAMPVSTPEDWVDLYLGDKEHFAHVFEHLHEPAVREAGFTPIPPKSTGSNIIHADIVQNLSKCDLVLGDMSALNLNVFFELGIRTALNKPLVLVKDDQTPEALIPFDTHIVNYHIYEGLNFIWDKEDQIKRLTEHIRVSYEKNDKSSALWEHFGVMQSAVFSPRKATPEEKLDLLLTLWKSIETRLTELEYSLSAHPEEQLISPSSLAAALGGESYIKMQDLAKEISRSPLKFIKAAEKSVEQQKALESAAKAFKPGLPIREQAHPEQQKKSSPKKK